MAIKRIIAGEAVCIILVCSILGGCATNNLVQRQDTISQTQEPPYQQAIEEWAKRLHGKCPNCLQNYDLTDYKDASLDTKFTCNKCGYVFSKSEAIGCFERE